MPTLTEAMKSIKKVRVAKQQADALETEVMLITADEAEAMLLTVPGPLANRKLRQTEINMWAGAMLRGDWRLNGETIKFSKDGVLIDGQHRLMGVILAAKTNPEIEVAFMVVRGLPEAVFDTIDQGRKRTIVDALYMQGVAYPFNVAAGLRAVLILEQKGYKRGRFTVQQQEDAQVRHPRVAYWSREYGNTRAMKALIPSGLIAVLTVAEEKHSTEEVTKFLRQLESGANLTEGDAALALRNRFASMQGSKRGMRENITLYYCITAWNAYINKKPLLRLGFREGSEMPEVA